MDFLPLVLLGILAFCDGVLAGTAIDQHDILFGSYVDEPVPGSGSILSSSHECKHLYVDTTPIMCSDFITKIPRSSAFLCFVDAAHYLLYTDDYYFLLHELKQIPIPEEIPEPVSTSRECQTNSKLLLGYWKDYGELCWIVWPGRQAVQCAECVNDYCCREYNKTDPTHVLPPTNHCRPSGYTIQKFIVYCAYLYGDPYDGYFYMHYTYLPSCCECKTNICVAGKQNNR